MYESKKRNRLVPFFVSGYYQMRKAEKRRKITNKREETLPLVAHFYLKNKRLKKSLFLLSFQL